MKTMSRFSAIHLVYGFLCTPLIILWLENPESTGGSDKLLVYGAVSLVYLFVAKTVRPEAIFDALRRWRIEERPGRLLFLSAAILAISVPISYVPLIGTGFLVVTIFGALLAFGWAGFIVLNDTKRE